MKILAFETSCDDTSVAIVKDGTKVLANIKQSQIEHTEYGGVVPEIAARLHAERWREVFESCLVKAQCTISDIDYLAVTQGPGLQTSLLNGTTAASFLSLLYEKPVIPVHHILGHICSPVLEREVREFDFPVLTLTVSGGHTNLYRCESFLKHTLVGQTRDDAAGEAFDKVAKMLGLGYPGGPIVSQWAEKGDGHKYLLPRVFLEKDSLDFSFSGLKAAVYRLIQERDNASDETFIADVCASFQQCVIDTFLKKIQRAFEKFPSSKALHFVGGVSANKQLRESFQELCKKYQKQFFTTAKFDYSTDNAAMIASAAYFLIRENPSIGQVQFLDSNARLEI